MIMAAEDTAKGQAPYTSGGIYVQPTADRTPVVAVTATWPSFTAEVG